MVGVPGLSDAAQESLVMSVHHLQIAVGYVLVKSSGVPVWGDALRAVVWHCSNAGKNDRKGAVDWHDGTFAAEGDKCSNLLFRWKGSTPRAEFLCCFKDNRKCSRRAGMESQRHRETTSGLRIDGEDGIAGSADIYSFDQTSHMNAQVCVHVGL